MRPADIRDPRPGGGGVTGVIPPALTTRFVHPGASRSQSHLLSEELEFMSLTLHAQFAASFWIGCITPI